MLVATAANLMIAGFADAVWINAATLLLVAMAWVWRDHVKNGVRDTSIVELSLAPFCFPPGSSPRLPHPWWIVAATAPARQRGAIRMIYTRPTTKSVDLATHDLEAAVAANGFGLLHTYNFRTILAGKGFALPGECRVFEVCNPKQASEVLAVDMALNMVLPCRVSIYEDKGRTIIGMVPPSDLLPLVSVDPAIAASAHEVEATMKKIIDDAAG